MAQIQIDRSNLNIISLQDKINKLLSMRNSLVLVQVQEVERIKVLKSRTPRTNYINQLYKHYVIEGKPKHYLTEH